MMDNKTLLAIALSIMVILGFQFLTPKQEMPPPPPQAQTEEKAQDKVVPTGPKAVTPVAPVVDATPAGGEKDIKVETDLFTAVFSSKGGTVKSWELKSYKDKIKRPLVLLSKTGVLPSAGIGSGAGFELASVNFQTNGKDITLDGNNKIGILVFEYAKDGVSVRRTYTFNYGRYDVELTDEVSGLPEYWITLGSDFGIIEVDESMHSGPALLTGSDLKEFKPGDLKEPVVFKEALKWIAQEDKYFVAALAPQTPVEEARVWLYKEKPAIAFKAKPGVNKFYLYAGPKEHDGLAKLNLGLEHVIDFGFFSIIARPLFWVLKFFYGFMGNYGWAIILLTIVVRIPFIPIVEKGQASMKRLQALQPKMNEIKEKYKKDPKKMQLEMSELYKKHKVNPLGGCLPMLLQIPVFFALYKVLLVSIELRGAPFMLWITDLSAPDTLFGHVAGFSLGGPLPYLMGATMFIQQKMTPSTMDPKQAKMMLFMPVIFTFMFLNFASGLVLYWLINNLLSIGQQFVSNRRAASQPAA
ncbi:MAG: membrane protein insertase YidC [Nitrospirae bacterium]|nr:membrane protein insertase YidC [Nitrospirota bacterium]